MRGEGTFVSLLAAVGLWSCKVVQVSVCQYFDDFDAYLLQVLIFVRVFQGLFESLVVARDVKLILVYEYAKWG